MTAKPPPVPAENRSPKGPGEDPSTAINTTVDTRDDETNLREQGEHGNIVQNTSHRGRRHDR